MAVLRLIVGLATAAVTAYEAWKQYREE